MAIFTPMSVSPWSEWWHANADLVERVFSRYEYLRLKYRRLSGARQILEARGQLPETQFPTGSFSGSCSDCGERTTNHSAGPGGGYVSCPTCGTICVYDCILDRE
jgi:ribosomal protein S27E